MEAASASQIDSKATAALRHLYDTVRDLRESRGWEVGVGPSIVIVDAGIANSLTTTTLKEDVCAFIFSQKGLMAGIGVQRSKISRINR